MHHSEMQSLFQILLLPVLLAGAISTTCPRANPINLTCKHGYIYLLDASNQIPRDKMNDMFQFVRNRVINRVDYDDNMLAIDSFGASPPPFDFANNYPAVCDNFNQINNDALMNGGKPTSLTDALKATFKTYQPLTPPAQITIFTNTQDESDAYSAATYMKQNHSPSHLTIVALGGNAAIFTDQGSVFPTVIPVFSLFANMSEQQQIDLGQCIVCTSCITATCHICDQFTSATPPPATMKPTTPVIIPPTQPSTPESDDGPLCSCNLQSLWIDVIVLIDNSAATGQAGTYDLLEYVQDTFANVNIVKNGSTEQMYTMMGIIYYNSAATVLYPLGSLDSASLQAIQQIPYFGNVNATNIDSAILLAMQQFSWNGRSNARQVILTAAKDYYPGSYKDPQQRASVFKKTGVIAVYDFVDRNHNDSSTLKSLASPGYYSRNTDSPSFNMPQALCNANCFCPKYFTSYKVDNTSGFPTAGCYQYVQNVLTFAHAAQSCQRLGGGYVAMEKNTEKAAFLASLVQSTDRYWTGFKWDNIAGSWVWNDGKKVTSSYQPWLISPAHSQGQDCSFVQQVQGVSKWTQEVCGSSPGHTFVCEQPACDSVHYCAPSP